jgi:predicted N-acyltransferase
MAGDTGRISVCHAIDEIGRAQWSAVTDAARAPVFYDYVFLRGYEAAPLQQTSEFFYLKFGEPAVAVLPAYVQSSDDPLGILSALGLPGKEPGDLILVTHIAHCYDTCLPALPGKLTPRLAESACTALADVARQAGVKWFAFLNVDGSSALAAALAKIGLAKIPMNTRFNRDLSGWRSAEDFIAAIPSQKRRAIMRQSRRLADRAGMRYKNPDPAAGAPDAVELCQRTTTRHGTAAYYPDQFGEFVVKAAELITVTEIWRDGRLGLASISLRDATRFHMWAGGIDYELMAGVRSAFPLLLLPAIEDAIATGRTVLEGGRGNPATKLKYRLNPVDLMAFVGTS